MELYSRIPGSSEWLLCVWFISEQRDRLLFSQDAMQHIRGRSKNEVKFKIIRTSPTTFKMMENGKMLYEYEVR